MIKLRVIYSDGNEVFTRFNGSEDQARSYYKPGTKVILGHDQSEPVEVVRVEALSHYKVSFYGLKTSSSTHVQAYNEEIKAYNEREVKRAMMERFYLIQSNLIISEKGAVEL